jgi:hypothetical protein
MDFPPRSLVEQAQIVPHSGVLDGTLIRIPSGAAHLVEA